MVLLFIMRKFVIIALFFVTPVLVAAADVSRSDDGNQKQAVVCIQVITAARSRETGEVRDFPTPCDVPEGWERLPFGYSEEKQAKPKKEEKLAKNEQPTPPQKPSMITKLPKKFSHLRGRILLQAQSRGQAWYVNPKTGARSFLGRSNDAFTTMRKQGVGVSNADFERLFGVVPAGHQKLYVKNDALGTRLAGSILLQIERNGEAYYLDPANQTGYYLGRPTDAFAVMRGRGLGITDANISEVPITE